MAADGTRKAQRRGHELIGQRFRRERIREWLIRSFPRRPLADREACSRASGRNRITKPPEGRGRIIEALHY